MDFFRMGCGLMSNYNFNSLLFKIFLAAVCKTVRPMLSDRCPVCLSCLPVCNVGVLRPNGVMDQDETRR